MKTDIWMPLYIGDYLADTMRLSTEQHGAYILMLMEYWRSGPLPDDDEELAAMTKLPLSQWRKHRKKLVRFFAIQEGYWRHKRVDEELAAAAARREAASKNGKKGGRPRKQTESQPKAKQKPEKTHSFLPAFEKGGFQKAKQKPGKSSSPSPSPSQYKTHPLPGAEVTTEGGSGDVWGETGT